MALVFKTEDDKPGALHALIVGKQGAGKTTTLASLLVQKTLLLYSRYHESHSATYMKSGVSLFEGASVKNLIAVPFDTFQDQDKQIEGLDVSKSIAVGSKLTADQSIKKIYGYLRAAAEIGVKSVAVDSALSLFTVFGQSSEWKMLCRTAKGGTEHNNFEEAKAYLRMHADLNTLFIDLKDAGINVVMTLPAMEIDGAMKPHLPMFSIAESLPFLYQDVLILTDRNTGSEGPIFDFSMSLVAIKKDQNSKVVKTVNLSPRLHLIPPKHKDIIQELEPNLWYLKDQVDYFISHRPSAQEEK